ncbi:MAG: OmpA family protein [Mangrovibacterium sp.]
MKSLTVKLTALVLVMGLLASCASMNSTQKGGAIGAGAGAALGALVGHFTGNTAVGAAIGTAVGGGAGAIIGNQMDKQAKKIEETVPGAEVTTINEGQAIEVTFDGLGDGITFPTNSSTLSAESKANLSKMVSIFKEFPDTYLSISGHTDDKGADDYNLSLSEKRANSVSSYLISQGIASSKITTEWYGETKPRVANDTDENRAKNRRVQILIVPNEKMIQDAQKQAGEL